MENTDERNQIDMKVPTRITSLCSQIFLNFPFVVTIAPTWPLVAWISMQER